MDLYTIHDRDTWQAMVDELAETTRMAAALTDAGGAILQSAGDRYPLCQVIRDNREALTFICSQTNTVMLAQVRHTLQPVLEECEAGLIRVVVPIVRSGQVVGQLTACGLAGDPEEIDPFLIASQVGITEERVNELLPDTPIGDLEQLRAIADRTFERVNPDG